MKLINKIVITIAIILLSVSCLTKSNLSFKQNINKYYPTLDTSAPILFMHYNPYACLSCNSAVSNIINNKVIAEKYENNIIWLFNNVRKAELEGYKKDFNQNISSKAVIISNDSIFFKIIINQIKNRKDVNVNDAFCLVFDPYFDSLFGGNMRNPQTIQKILNTSN